jgi:hypothetical protein
MTDLFPESLKLHNEINSAPAHPPCRSSRFLTATSAASGLYPKITLRSREVVAGVLEAIVLLVRIPPSRSAAPGLLALLYKLRD